MRLKIKEVIWYFLALIALLILVYMEKNIIVDTYLYVVTLNIFILLLPYAILKKMNSLHYYSYTRVRDKKRLEKVGNLVKNSYLYR